MPLVLHVERAGYIYIYIYYQYFFGILIILMINFSTIIIKNRLMLTTHDEIYKFLHLDLGLDLEQRAPPACHS